METIEITKVLTGRKVEVKKSVNHGAPSLATVSFDDFNATDRRVALQVGNIFERSGSKFKLKSFGVAVAPAGQTGTSLDVDRNPYNFVAFAGTAPWKQAVPNADHTHWRGDLLHGEIRFTLRPRSPIFTPVGGRQDSDPLLLFFRSRRWNDLVDRYAIPGSTIKGLLRSLIEASANDRLGIVSKEHEIPIPYKYRPRGGGSSLPSTKPKRSVKDLAESFGNEPKSLDESFPRSRMATRGSRSVWGR